MRRDFHHDKEPRHCALIPRLVVHPADPVLRALKGGALVAVLYGPPHQNFELCNDLLVIA